MAANRLSPIDPLILKVPDPSLILVIGPSGSGKSTFARKHFRSTEVVSSDFCRALISDNEADQSVTGEAFALLHSIVNKRLRLGRLTVVDATNVEAHARRSLRSIARRWRVPAVAVVFNVPVDVTEQWNRNRPGRQVPPDVMASQRTELRKTLRSLPRESYHAIYILKGPADIDRARIVRARL